MLNVLWRSQFVNRPHWGGVVDRTCIDIGVGISTLSFSGSLPAHLQEKYLTPAESSRKCGKQGDCWTSKIK